MKVVISAGGRGSRISSITGSIPKPMIPVCGRPVLEHQLNCLSSQGFHDVILTVGYLGDQIRNYFRDGAPWDVSIEYYVEREPLGTAGALVAMKEKLTDDFFMINGDLVFDIDFDRMF